MDQGFHFGMVQVADSVDAHFRRCFNCLEEGHQWRDCKKTLLLQELQEILDREALNRAGDTGNKGGCIPHESQEWQGKGCYPNQTCTVKSKSKETPFHYWKQDALSHWLGPENLGWALVNGI